MSETSLAGRTVCIVDDDELASKLLAVKLAEHAVIVLPALDSTDLFALMERHRIDCVLMDLSLGGESGLFVLSQMRERFLDVPPTIILSANDSQRAIIKAFRSGATDYLIKQGLRTEEILESIRTAIERRDADLAMRDRLQRLTRQSLFDEMTGMYRWETVEAMLAKLTEAPPASQKPFAILLIRVDQYESVSRQAGQVAGQRLIRAFASRLKTSVRLAEVCGRFDANTFVYVVDTAATRPGMADLAHRLDAALRFPLDLETISFGVSASFGTALYPEDGAEPGSLMSVAESALAKAGVSQEHSAEHAGEASAPSPAVVRAGNRRLTPRHRVFRPGKIIVNSGRSVVDCTVRDVSEGGARLRLGAIFPVPQSFDLLVVGSGAARPVQRVWQQSNEVGVSYAGAKRET